MFQYGYVDSSVEPPVWCKKRHFLRHLYIKCIILPRQARDKHRENAKKSGVFRRVQDPGAYAIQSSVLPSLMVFVLSMVVALSFTNVWDIGVSTVLFSFLLDESRAKAGEYQGNDDPNYSVTGKYWPGAHMKHNDMRARARTLSWLARDKMEYGVRMLFQSSTNTSTHPSGSERRRRSCSATRTRLGRPHHHPICAAVAILVRAAQR
jgi:hypothetical protein